MKRKSIIAIILICLCLSGCSSETPSDSSSESSTTPSLSETTSVSSESDTVSVSEETVSEEPSVSDIEGPSLEDMSLKELCSGYFMLGVGINGSTLDNQTLNIPEYMKLSGEQFNSCTMTNLMKSCYILNQQGSQANLKAGNPEPALSFATIDPTLKWCMENGMKMRGHTLVWHTQAPEWFFREDYKDNGKYVDKETMLLRMESYIRQLLTHVQTEFPGVIYCWDVVNEAVDPESAAPGSAFMCRTKLDGNPNPWYETIGEDYVKMAFTYARQYADPEVKLFYNDYNTFQMPKLNGIYSLCESLKAEGLIDGIGMQGYWGIDYPTIDALTYAFTKYAKLDLEIHVTELSIGVSEENEEQFEKQATQYGRVFTMLYGMDTDGGGPANITSVTLFGLVDHYREGDGTNSRLYDKDYNPKPAYYKIRNIMERKYKQ